MNFQKIKYIFQYLLKYSFVVTLLFFCGILSSCNACNRKTTAHFMNIKEVLIDYENYNQSDYEYGKYIYPQYSYMGLPDHFLIKKKADIAIPPSKIKIIKVSKSRWLSDDIQSVIVKISFISTIEALKEYTKENLNQRIAFAIDEKILSIAKIIDPIESEMSISISGMKIDILKEELLKISNNVVLEEE